MALGRQNPATAQASIARRVTHGFQCFELLIGCTPLSLNDVEVGQTQAQLGMVGQGIDPFFDDLFRFGQLIQARRERRRQDNHVREYALLAPRSIAIGRC